MPENPVLSIEGHSKKYKIFEFLKYSFLALLPISGIYNGFHFINLGLFLLLVIMIIEIVIKKGNFDINADIFIVIVFLGLLNIVIGFIYTNIFDLKRYMNNSVGMFFFAIFAAYFAKSTIVKKDVFYKYIKMVALASSFFLFVQYYFYSKGIVILGYLPFIGIDALGDYVYIPVAYGRPNSFFLEPAHFAIYVLPVYAISLFKHQYITSVILLSALFMSTSSTGIVIGIIVTVFFLFQEDRIPVIMKWIFALVGIIVIFQYIPYIKESAILDKLSLTSLKKNVRVFGTIEYYKYFSPKELLLGVGLNQIERYMNVFANSHVKNYSNAFLFSFLSFGFLGGAIWNAYVVKLHSLSKNKILYIVFILIYFSDQILFNRNLLYLLLILFIFSENEGDLTKKYQVEVQLKEQK